MPVDLNQIHFVAEKNAKNIFTRVRYQNPKRGRNTCQNKALCEQLTNDSSTAASHRQAHSNFVFSRGRSGHQQIRHVQANNQEQQARGGGNIRQEIRHSEAAIIQAMLARFDNQSWNIAWGGVRSGLVGNALEETFEIATYLLEIRSRFHPDHDLQSPAILLDASILCPSGERHNDLRKRAS